METQELINKIIDDVVAGNNTDAGEAFKTAMGAKISDALEIKKVELAQRIYGGAQQAQQEIEQELEQDISQEDEIESTEQNG